MNLYRYNVICINLYYWFIIILIIKFWNIFIFNVEERRVLKVIVVLLLGDFSDD